ncbi:MAG: Sec-independent protein translocase protein TatB [Dokdonella sp.]
MFDVGFGKLALIAIVALLVLGPERLPRVARTVGALIRKARNSWNNVRADIERELAVDEMKNSMRDTIHRADVGADMRNAADDMRAAVKPDSGSPPNDKSDSQPANGAN